jgi:hypothetical protein
VENQLMMRAQANRNGRKLKRGAFEIPGLVFRSIGAH